MSQTEGSNPPPPQLPHVPFPNCSHQPKPWIITIKLYDRYARGRNSLIQCNSDTGGGTNVVEKENYRTHSNAKPDQSPHCQITDLVPTPLQTSTPDTPHTSSVAPRAFNLKHSLVFLPITFNTSRSIEIRHQQLPLPRIKQLRINKTKISIGGACAFRSWAAEGPNRTTFRAHNKQHHHTNEFPTRGASDRQM